MYQIQINFDDLEDARAWYIRLATNCPFSMMLLEEQKRD